MGGGYWGGGFPCRLLPLVLLAVLGGCTDEEVPGDDDTSEQSDPGLDCAPCDQSYVANSSADLAAISECSTIDGDLSLTGLPGICNEDDAATVEVRVAATTGVELADLESSWHAALSARGNDDEKPEEGEEDEDVSGELSCPENRESILVQRLVDLLCGASTREQGSLIDYLAEQKRRRGIVFRGNPPAISTEVRLRPEVMELLVDPAFHSIPVYISNHQCMATLTDDVEHKYFDLDDRELFLWVHLDRIEALSRCPFVERIDYYESWIIPWEAGTTR